MTQHRSLARDSDDRPIRKGVWEVLFEAWWVPVFVLPMAISLILQGVGIDFSVTLGAIPTLGIVLVLMWARNKQRRQRLACVARRDHCFECWLRHPRARRDSLDHRWAYGIATLEAGTLTFQALTGPDGQAIGRPSVFNGLGRLGHPEISAAERRGTNRSWRGLALDTDRGVIELLCPEEAGPVLSEVG